MTLGDEHGFTLVELLVAMVVSFVVLGAALTTFNSFYDAEHDNDDRNDTTELARGALDVQARQLRNLAKRVSSPVIDLLDSYDLIFQTSDPARTWVRYCLNTTTGGATSARGRVWTGELGVPDPTVATPVTPAMRSGCPGTGWPHTQIVADYVTNRRNGLDRPLFTYRCTVGTSCTSSAASYDQVINIATQLHVDTTPGTGPLELRVITGVYLRNQNQAPAASFVSSPSSASRAVVLNASSSTDFEGRTLSYYWFKQVMPATAAISCSSPVVSGTGPVRTLWGAAGYIGSGITLTHTFDPADGGAGSTRNIGLVVCDPGDRYDTAGIPPKATIAVLIPA